MADTKAPQNFRDAMQTVIQAIARAMAAPDSDIRFLTQLQMVCASKLRDAHGQAQQGAVGVGGAMPPGPGGPTAGPGGKPPGMSMPGNPAGGGAVNPMQPSLAAPGMMQGSPTPTPDELRRVIQQAGS